ncbi:GNAT family N-acetyltransferase [Falsirhodobacter algicola]|uniref:GNAT family N-acetyltransferase n=1 Tax=Falsirhodobacter algicola TaxID=2692330 RepID=UPI0028BE4B5B|nr:GNAT family N-acetyltransferase [Falsirhodobacter algicola]
MRRTLRPDHAIAMTDHGRLLGLCGFKTVQGAFVQADPQAMRDIFGRTGAGWRRAALGLLQQDTDNRRFLIDGLCVAGGYRGRGIGTALIAAICDEARTRGHPAVRLDVVDSNLRARDLYLRLGFHEVDRVHNRIAAPIYGFGATITMVRAV